MKKIVIALGGNALQEAGKPATAEAQLEGAVEKTSEYISGPDTARDIRSSSAHGNARPQVGRIVLQNEYATPVSPAMPFDVCGAMRPGLYRIPHSAGPYKGTAAHAETSPRWLLW